MVKNTKGGNKTKSMARKKQNQVTGHEMVHPDNKNQMLVEVFKVGNQYDYWTFDPKLFKSADENKVLWLATKRAGGQISPAGTIFLVEHRECDSVSSKKRVDVLHVYTPEQKKILEEEGCLSFGIKENIDLFTTTQEVDVSRFGDEEPFDFDDI
jgi:hypothetical protein